MTIRGVDKGLQIRAGFVAKTSINRQDFGVSWNDTMDKGGIVVSNIVEITIDAEAILEDEWRVIHRLHRFHRLFAASADVLVRIERAARTGFRTDFFCNLLCYLLTY